MTDNEMFVVKKNNGCPKYHCTAENVGVIPRGCTQAPVPGFYLCEGCLSVQNALNGFAKAVGA